MWQQFSDMWRAVCPAPPARDVYSALERAHGEPHRRYHTLAHVADCLHLFEPANAHAPHLVCAAIWFHDVVNDTRQPDNEERSAEWAERALRDGGTAAADAQRVGALILATKHHDAGEDDPDAALLLDIDLSILGREADVFDRYDAQIREEYAWVPDEQYTMARRSVLDGFLARPRIYRTADFAARFESQARLNLQRALDRL